MDYTMTNRHIHSMPNMNSDSKHYSIHSALPTILHAIATNALRTNRPKNHHQTNHHDTLGYNRGYIHDRSHFHIQDRRHSYDHFHESMNHN